MNNLVRLDWAARAYDNDDLRRLAECPLTPQVRHYGGVFRHCTSSGRPTLRGVHLSLETCFWRRLESDEHMQKSARKAATHTGAKSRADAKERGSKIHAEIQRYLDGKTLPNRPTPQTQAFIAETRRCELRPVTGEFQLVDRDSGTGTSVDGLMVDRKNRLVLVEVKTGGDGAFDAAEGRLRFGMFAGCNDGLGLPVSARTRAEFQLLVAAETLRDNYGVALGDDSSTCLVVAHLPGRATPPCVLYPVLPQTAAFGRGIMEILRRSKKTRTARAATKRKKAAQAGKKNAKKRPAAPKNPVRQTAAKKAAETRRRDRVQAAEQIAKDIISTLFPG